MHNIMGLYTYIIADPISIIMGPPIIYLLLVVA